MDSVFQYQAGDMDASVHSPNDIPLPHRIFCNRSLNMKTIKAVGFDMDYTLGVYKPETFEVLAYNETLKKLVKAGYPEVILTWQFDWNWMVRGLAIDKVRGNVIKLDRHHYVKVAYHGFRELTRDERRTLYDASKVQAYEEPHFALIDTLFALAESYLFCQLVDLKDSHPDHIKKTYHEMYRDVRVSIDNAHRDGSIKRLVADDPGKYITRDPLLVPALQKIKDSGRKLFIVTNSLWEYTDVMMSYLFDEPAGRAEQSKWLSMFDIVIVGASKPSFFMHSNPIYEVDPNDGRLSNVWGVPVDKRIFQGGHFKQLHDFLKIQSGSQILYVGDHIYGDILRSKKEIGWRTMLIVEEIEREIQCLMQNRQIQSDIAALMEVKDDLDDRMQQTLWQFECVQKRLGANFDDDSDDDLHEALRQTVEERNSAREALRETMREYHRRFHPVWGQLLKTGVQNSRFAQQIEVYACLYTGRLTNLLAYPPSKMFQSTRDVMPHES
jgi:HAD superfamily 5'-nucleotidase-like hydrolase